MDLAYYSEQPACEVDKTFPLVHALAANLPQGVAILDRNLRFVLWNHCLEDLTGLASQEAIGKQILDLYPSIPGMGIVRNAQRALAGETISARAMIARAEGKARVIGTTEANLSRDDTLDWAVLAYSPWRDADGAIAGVILVLSDFSERIRAKRQLDDSRIRSRAVIDHMLDGLAMISSEGIIESFNLAAERIFNYRAEEVIGKNVFELFVCPYAFAHQCNLQHYLGSETGANAGSGWEVAGIRKDRSNFPLELVVSKIELRGKHMFTALLRDISKRKAAEEELRVMGERLRQLVAHQESVREAERTRIAHELHDELGGLLTAARFDVNRLGRLPSMPAGVVDKLRESLDAAIGSTRSIIADLRPPVIDHLGLWGAIEWYADELAMRRGLRCQVALAPELQDMHPAHSVSIALFRIVQEALSNVVKPPRCAPPCASTDMERNADRPRNLRVLLVDDHPMVLQGLHTMLQEAGDIDVVAVAADAATAIAAVRHHRLDVVVSDMALPDKAGLMLLKMIKAEQPDLAVLMLSMYAEEVFAVRALRLGASGYLMKDVDAVTLVNAIRRAASGGKYISPGMAERLASQLDKDRKGALHERLSEREFEVFRLIAAGKSLTEIGIGLHVSVKTVSGYRTRIIEKTDLRTNADFTRYALEHCLID